MKVKYKSNLVGEDYNPFTERYEGVYEEAGVVLVPEVQKEKYLYNKKIIKSGDVVEVYEYSKPIMVGSDAKILHNGKNKKGEKTSTNINRSCRNLRRLINSNVTGHDLFITLTYKDNMSDIKQGKKDFKNFIKRWNYRRSEALKYVYVVEFQKRGAVHFHCIFFGVGFIANKELSKLWGHGFVKVNNIKECDNVGAYVVKYMSKDMIDDRFKGSDLYGRSKGNLNQPIEIKEPKNVESFLDSFNSHDCIMYSTSFCNDYNGYISYTQYKPKK